VARILMLCPSAGQALNGNSTTARRLIAGLEKSGHPCTLAGEEFSASVEADLIVALHAVKCGPLAAQLAGPNKLPYVILFTGTDLNGKPPGRAKLAVEQAAACVALAPHAQKRAREIYSIEEAEFIPQAARPLPEGRSAATLPDTAPHFEAHDFVVLQPCGIRSIKAPLVAVKALAPLAARYPRLRLCIVGPEIEAAEAQTLTKLLQDHPWASWPGAYTPVQMAAAMRRANLVISTSRSEGAAPNALLEAALFGRPICASNIAAHRYFPGPEHLFHDDHELRSAVEQCMVLPQETALKGRRFQELTRTRFDPTRETVAWNRLVRRFTSD
jgi:glycosyltransferase involved in cell wall biosynthesis